VYGSDAGPGATDQYTSKYRWDEQLPAGGPPLEVSTKHPDSDAVIITAVNPSNNPVRDFVVIFFVLRALAPLLV
jgi:hypothetical protein